MELRLAIGESLPPTLKEQLRRTRVRLRKSEQERGKPQEQTRSRPHSPDRDEIADRHLSGEGLEIGALHWPLPLPAGAKARYVDVMSSEELEQRYPRSRGNAVKVDVVDDGEHLNSIDDASVDFLVANHMLEHTRNPLGTIENHLRVLRDGGVLFYALPDKRSTFDHERPLTTVDHLVGDYRNGPSEYEHYEEWARHVVGAEESQVEATANKLAADKSSIHFHTFTPENFAEAISRGREELSLPLTLAHLQSSEKEFVCVIKKDTGNTLG